MDVRIMAGVISSVIRVIDVFSIGIGFVGLDGKVFRIGVVIRVDTRTIDGVINVINITITSTLAIALTKLLNHKFPLHQVALGVYT